MRIIALILAILLAFPNLGHSLGNNCCSGEMTETMSCHSDVADIDMDSTANDCHDEENNSCAGQCDCSCCQATVMATHDSKVDSSLISDLVKTEPLNMGTPFAIGIANMIWQPPRMG